MLTKVEVRTSQGNLLVLPMEDILDGLLIEEILGLDPVKATLVSSSFAGLDGEQYHSSKRDPRNIKLKLALEPDFAIDTAQDLRNRIYDFFMPKSEVSLRFFMASGLVVDITGRVETCEAPQFTQEPVADISVMCFNPDFAALNSVKVSGVTVSSNTETGIPYPGTVETGVVFTLKPNRPLNEFSIYHNPPNGNVRMLEFATALVAGDVLTISTVTGDKGATLLRNGVGIPVLYGISPQSSWLELEKGNNGLTVYAVGTPIPFDIEYVAKYGAL